ASSFYATPIETLSISDYQDLIATNMSAPLFLAQACRGMLKESNGVIINMCDIHAKRPLKAHTIYCMAKAGLQMMTYSLANELAPEIRVNAIAPGAIEWPSSGISDDDIARVVNDIPLARKGNAQDIAQAIAYLVQAPYVSGQILTVDGGRQHKASLGA
ncbi:MAG: SDR family oxidoreductase, partial [Psychrobium sp.]|nr:SDR family oxidoreductase [Psychrobium sp.]